MAKEMNVNALFGVCFGVKLDRGQFEVVGGF
jgi:hypothetical protein